MPIWKAAILGIVQGAAEFLPISSSGHLVIIKEWMGVDLGSGGEIFDVMLHLGTLIAICIAYWKDIKKLIVEAVRIVIDVCFNIGVLFAKIAKRSVKYRKVVRTSYRKFVMLIIVSTIPTAIIGALLSDIVEMVNGVALVPGICLLFTAVILLIADFADEGTKRAGKTTYPNALVIGVAQGVATIPGISRSGSTITACLLCGMEKSFAVKYSFLMSVPAVLGAGVWELRGFSAETFTRQETAACAVAVAVAAVVGYLAICLMMVVMKKRKYKIFSVYCAVVGVATIIRCLW